MKKIVIMLMLFSGSFITSYGQTDYSTSILRKISMGLDPNPDRLKDSIAFYSFAYELKIERIKDSTVVNEISANDSIEALIIKDRSFLQQINYSPIMGMRKKITLIIPVSVIVTDYNSKNELNKKISFYDFTERIEKLFNVGKQQDALSNFVFFRPIMVYFNKRVYD